MMQNIARTLMERCRLIFIVLPAVITALACVALLSLRIETSLDEFIPQSHPFITIHKQLEKIFGGLNQVSLVIKVREGEYFPQGRDGERSLPLRNRSISLTG